MTDRILALKIVQAGGASSHGFVWPLTVGATVTAPDWKPTNDCGHGLHAWKDGEGNVNDCFYHANEGVIGMVVDADAADVINLGGKIKMRECVILFVGSVREAAAWISARRPGAKVIYGTATAGDRGTATAGDSGTATAGDSGTATAGEWGTATAGEWGTATAGEWGSIAILYYDRTIGVYRRKIAECDPNGPIKPWRRYTLDENGNWIEGAEVPESERPAALLAAKMATK